MALEPGDIALIRTGWGRYFGIDNARYLQGEPGIDLPGARWLIERGVVAIGCDNMAVEVLPNPNHGISMPVHQHALAEAGVYLIENLALDELARDGGWELLLHPAGDQVPRCHGIAGAAGGDAMIAPSPASG